MKFMKPSTSYEKVVYINPQFNFPLPQEIMAFKIPAQVKVKEIKWG